jgi:ATP-dependent DNA helicase RecQ
MDWLEQEGYIVVDMEHSALGVTQKAAEVLFKGKKLEMMVRKSLRVGGEEKPKKKKQETADLRAAADDTGELYNVLRRTRTKLAQEENVPAYVIFSNATLTEMAEIKPRTMAELMNVSGVGSVKAMRYGKEFLRAISDFGA